MSKPLFLGTRYNGYSPEQCGHTMTVGELIRLLEDFDDDRPVYFRNDNGYTYGSISDHDISIQEEWEEE